MAEKIISVKKYIEPITETVEFTSEISNIEEPIKTNHHTKKIKKKVKIDNSIYDDILISNEQPIINQDTSIDNVNVNVKQENTLPRVTKVTPRALIKKKKGH